MKSCNKRIFASVAAVCLKTEDKLVCWMFEISWPGAPWSGLTTTTSQFFLRQKKSPANVHLGFNLNIFS